MKEKQVNQLLDLLSMFQTEVIDKYCEDNNCTLDDLSEGKNDCEDADEIQNTIEQVSTWEEI